MRFWPIRRSPPLRFDSNEALLGWIDGLAARLESVSPADAARMREGLRCLNGLTDGWALLWEDVRAIRKHPSAILPEDIVTDLASLDELLRRMVTRG